MKCPHCSASKGFTTIKTVPVRRYKGDRIEAMKRNRRCNACSRTFVSFEMPFDSLDFKILAAIKKALETHGKIIEN